MIDALAVLRTLPGMEHVRLNVAGYIGSRDERWYGALRKRAAAAGLDRHVNWMGEVDRDAKRRLLDSIDVLSVPTVYPESKGISILEALARGVPVVQPAHGAFPEMIAATGGGLLVPPGDSDALAQSLAGLLRDEAQRRRLGEAGRRAVREQFTERRMAEGMMNVYTKATG